MSREKLAEYDPSWTDEQLLAWDEDFRDDGVLFLVCSERNVNIDEYRRVLVEHIRFRFRRRSELNRAAATERENTPTCATAGSSSSAPHGPWNIRSSPANPSRPKRV